jgi:hypothetical protein
MPQGDGLARAKAGSHRIPSLKRFFAAPRLDPAGSAPIWRLLALTW